MTLRLTAALAAALALAPLAAPASAQYRLADAQVSSEAHHVCALYDHGDHAEPGPVIDLAAIESARRGVTYSRVTSGGGAAATFQVDYSDQFTPEAKAAFQRAVNIWSRHLTSSVPIRIKADFEALGERVLAQAGPRITLLVDQNENAVAFPFALADAILNADADTSRAAYDIEATFSSSFPRFYFGLDGNPASNQIDFATTVLHEIGHGLGFIGSGDVDDGSGTGRDVECNGTAGVGCIGLLATNGIRYPLIFDEFLEDLNGASIFNTDFYPNNSRPLGDLLKGQALYVNTPTVYRVYGGRAPVWAPATFEPGSSFSHWDEVVIRNSSAALMTPNLAGGEAYQDPGDITCAFFFAMGWTLGSGCQTLGVANEPRLLASGVALDLAGPNPTRGATSLRLLQPAAGHVRATLHDALGRQLAVLLDGPAPTQQDLALATDRLAPGVYHVVARTDGGTVTRAVTVVR